MTILTKRRQVEIGEEGKERISSPNVFVYNLQIPVQRSKIYQEDIFTYECETDVQV